MLIKNQKGLNRRKLINANDMKDIELNYTVITMYFSNSCIELGRYSSEEKANKVMDMLEEAYKKERYLIPLEKPQNDETCQVVFSQPIVFHMPQDDEVEV